MMWDDEEEDDVIMPGTPRATSLLENFEAWENGHPKYFNEAELEFLFRHFHYFYHDGDHKVLKILDLGMEMFPNSGVLQLCSAKFLFDKGNVHESLKLIDMSKLLDPKNQDTAILEAECFEELEQYDRALEILQEAESYTSEFNPELNIRLVSLLFHFEKRESAIKKLSKLIEMEYIDSEINNIATLSFEPEDLVEAVDILIDKNPYSDIFWNFKGKVYMMNEEWDEAIQSFEFAHYIKESEPEPLYNLGICYKEKKNYFKARTYFADASALGFDKRDCVIETAICMNRSGDHVQARFLLQNLVPDSEDDYELYFEIGFSFLHDAMAAKALTFFEKSYQIMPILDTLLLMAECNFVLDRESDILDNYNKAKELRFMQPDQFVLTFFGIFYRLEMLPMATMVYEEEISQKNENELLMLILKSLVYKLEGRNKVHHIELLNCFMQDPAKSLEYLESIDKELLHDPEVISIRELF